MMAKPDNRANNVERLQEQVQNTEKNLNEAEDYLAEHADEISEGELQTIQAKNENRQESMEGMKSEIQDEAEARQK